MSTHSYPRSSMLADYGRAALGLMFTGVPLALAETTAVVFWILAGMTALFASYFGRTALRHGYRLHLTETGLREHMLRSKSVAFDEATELKVHYFATRRDQSDGWMQITVKGPEGLVRFDSEISNYEPLMEAVWRALGPREIRMSDTTLANLAGLGYERPRAAKAQETAESAL